MRHDREMSPSWIRAIMHHHLLIIDHHGPTVILLRSSKGKGQRASMGREAKAKAKAKGWRGEERHRQTHTPSPPPPSDISSTTPTAQAQSNPKSPGPPSSVTAIGHKMPSHRRSSINHPLLLDRLRWTVNRHLMYAIRPKQTSMYQQKCICIA